MTFKDFSKIMLDSIIMLIKVSLFCFLFTNVCNTGIWKDKGCYGVWASES